MNIPKLTREGQIQHLIDIMFEVVSMTNTYPSFKNMSHEELMGWVARQLRISGYPTRPCGASWGLLEK
jgi:hypothetical protein